jgi:hypothetical protein
MCICNFSPEESFQDAAEECSKMAKHTKSSTRYIKGYMKALAHKKGLDVEAFISASSDSD